MARDIGDPWLILLLWGGGALLALTGAMCYSELGAAFPLVGGDYVYLREAYHPFVAFLSGWASFTVGFGAAIAAGAMGFAAYVLQLLPSEVDFALQVKGVALALIWSLTVVHVAGVGPPGGFLQQILTVLKIGAILLLIAGAFTVGNGDWQHLVTISRQPDVGPGTTGNSGGVFYFCDVCIFGMECGRIHCRRDHQPHPFHPANDDRGNPAGWRIICDS